MKQRINVFVYLIRIKVFITPYHHTPAALVGGWSLGRLGGETIAGVQDAAGSGVFLGDELGWGEVGHLKCMIDDTGNPWGEKRIVPFSKRK